jgi:exodeoxyribonuclease V alpha subunit
VIITQNDYTLGLMNGDIGMTLYDADQTLKVAFFDNNMQTVNGIRWFSTSRLSDVETAFALTVHKSQGSEFEHTLFVLPTPMMPILTKELMYTAITRAKKHFTLLHLGFT